MVLRNVMAALGKSKHTQHIPIGKVLEANPIDLKFFFSLPGPLTRWVYNMSGFNKFGIFDLSDA